MVKSCYHFENVLTDVTLISTIIHEVLKGEDDHTIAQLVFSDMDDTGFQVTQ